MKRSLLLVLTGLISLSTYAKNDMAKGSCHIKISKNKAKSKYKVLRNSEIDFAEILIKPLNRFQVEANISKVYVDFENVMNEKKNRILIFTKDKERLDVLENVNYKVVDFGRAIYFAVAYVGEGMKQGGFKGPGVSVSTMTQTGTIAENFFNLKQDEDTDFEVKVPASTIYRVFDKVDGEPEHVATKRHKSEMKMECSFKTVDITPMEIKKDDEIEITSGTIQE